MPKHIVKKIWIWIIVIYLVTILGMVFILSNSCAPFNDNPISNNSFVETVHAQTSIATSILPSAEPDSGCVVKLPVQFLIFVGLIFFIGSFILGIVINLVVELFHLIYLGLRERTYHTIKYGLFINLILSLVIFTIFSFFMLNQMGLL